MSSPKPYLSCKFPAATLCASHKLTTSLARPRYSPYVLRQDLALLFEVANRSFFLVDTEDIKALKHDWLTDSVCSTTVIFINSPVY
jgi:hypothetical protein